MQQTRLTNRLSETKKVLTEPDSVYSAKALHAVVDRAAKVDGPIVFWHTGGIPALFSDTAGVTAWRHTDPASTPFHS
jgi:1-aminocyclopropane-1-carboxylate deaminase/D-cysteine desulfhydrase-like pyridoxal-dependent ACC family enzyme